MRLGARPKRQMTSTEMLFKVECAFVRLTDAEVEASLRSAGRHPIDLIQNCLDLFHASSGLPVH